MSEQKSVSPFESAEFASRLKELFQYVAGSYSEFQDRTGIPKTSLTSYLKGPNPSKPGSEFFLVVKKKFPEIDLNYIFSGEGSLLLTDSVLQSVAEPQIDYTRNETRLMLRNQGKILEAHRELIETLKVLYSK